jgi:hypothetical protein
MANDIDNRGNKFPVMRRNVDTITLPNSASDEVTVTEAFNGVVGTICVGFGNATNSITGTLQVRDSDGFILYSKASIAENTNTVLENVDFLAAGELTIGMNPSGDPGSGGVDVDIVIMAV